MTSIVCNERLFSKRLNQEKKNKQVQGGGTTKYAQHTPQREQETSVLQECAPGNTQSFWWPVAILEHGGQRRPTAPADALWPPLGSRRRRRQRQPLAQLSSFASPPPSPSWGGEGKILPALKTEGEREETEEASLKIPHEMRRTKGSTTFSVL